jgi:hypothetical protein
MTLPRRGKGTVDVMTLVDEQPSALRAFVRARLPDEGEATLAAYPGLLAGDYDAPLDMLIEAARAQRATAAESALCERRDVLERLRRGTGADSAQSLGRVALTADYGTDRDG